MKRLTPRLGHRERKNRPDDDRHVVIFVHGILSNSSTFDRLLAILDEADVPATFDFWTFDYEYRQTLKQSSDQLAGAIRYRAFGSRRVDVVGHSMGGLVARLAVLRNSLPNVARIVTLATPNHGTVSGAQLNLLAQMTALGCRRFEPIYARAPGIIDLTNVHSMMRDELAAMHAEAPERLDGKSYVSIPAQYYHGLRQAGDEPPSMTMGGVSWFRTFMKMFLRLDVGLKPTHDGIVEERSNRLHPAPPGSSSEAFYMYPRTQADRRVLHVTHEAAADLDHITVTQSEEIADLLQAVLRAPSLDAAGIDPHLHCSPGLVRLRPDPM